MPPNRIANVSTAILRNRVVALLWKSQSKVFQFCAHEGKNPYFALRKVEIQRFADAFRVICIAIRVKVTSNFRISTTSSNSSLDFSSAVVDGC